MHTTRKGIRPNCIKSPDFYMDPELGKKCQMTTVYKIMMLPTCYFIKKNVHFSASVISDMISITQCWYLWSTLLQLTPKPHWKLFFVLPQMCFMKMYHSIIVTGQVFLQPSFLLPLQFLLCSCAHLWATDPSSCAKKYPVALSVYVTLQTRVADGSTCARVTRDKEVPFFFIFPL